jgi:PAS domain-containing protein
MNDRKLIIRRFSRAINEALRLQFGEIPSTNFIAECFNLRVSKANAISRETARKWLKGLTYPEAGRLQVLVDWLKLDPADLLISAEEKQISYLDASQGHVAESNSDAMGVRSFNIAQLTLDALSANIAILDKNGNILRVNRSWRQFAKSNSSVNTYNDGKAVNYLNVCDTTKGADQKIAYAMASGLRAVLSGALSEFAIKYPCHSPRKKRWFVAKVTNFRVGNEIHAVVSHEAITEKQWLKLDLPEPDLLIGKA